MTDTPDYTGTFFLPGPTEVRREVLAAMLQPMIAHRGAAFEAMFARIQQGLRHVFRTTRPVLASSSSATGLMEAAVRCAPPGRVLSLVNGAFAERFAHIARACGRDVTALEAPPGGTVPLEQVEQALAAGRYSAVTVVHSETSTGALADVRAVTALARRHGALCLVDSVTGVGGVPLEFDAWELDFALTGSQKALALPPGLAFAVASDDYLRTVEQAPTRGVYFDLAEFVRFGAKHQTPNTPALSLLYALERQLARIAAEGIEARWARHRAMAETTWAWAERLGAEIEGFRVAADAGARTWTVSALTVPPGRTPGDIVTAMAGRGYVIGGGYGALRETTFRIGHMGDHTLDALGGCLAACEEVMRQ